MTQTVHPCANPRCRDHEGNPRLTHQEICKPCHHRLRRTLDRIVIDYVILRSTYPKPISTQSRRAPGYTSGHPAQWASDTARHIADLLDATSEAIRDQLHHLPPPPRQRAETRVVEHAYATLIARIDQLADYPGAGDTLQELEEAHNRIRHSLGQDQHRILLPAPCPSCGTLGVVRTIADDRSDTIQCHNCGRTITESEYGLYARIIIDEMLDAAEESSPLTIAVDNVNIVPTD